MNVCIYRIPRDESIAFPPSRCPNCGRKLTFWDLIPIFSFLFLKGKCRYCGEKINLRYPIVEILSACLFIGFYLIFGISYFYFKFVLLFSALLVVFFVDLSEKIIPDLISIPFTLIGIILSTFETFIPKLTTLIWQNANLYSSISSLSKVKSQVGLLSNNNNKLPIINSLLGIAIGYFILLLIAYLGKYFLKKEAMGGGDVKLAGMLGSFLGWKLNCISLYFSFLIGGSVAIVLLIIKKKNLKDQIAFGPAIILGALLSILYGEKFLQLIVP